VTTKFSNLIFPNYLRHSDYTMKNFEELSSKWIELEKVFQQQTQQISEMQASIDSAKAELKRQREVNVKLAFQGERHREEILALQNRLSSVVDKTIENESLKKNLSAFCVV